MSPLSPDNPGNSTAALRPLSQPVLVADKLAALSPDEPLPDVAWQDEAHLLVQSPDILFLYWNYARDPFQTLQKALGAAAAHYRLGVRLVDLESGEEDTHPASPERAHWYDVRPGRAYRADVGFYSDAYPFVRLMSSEVARAPLAAVSTVSAVESDFRVAAGDFSRVLNEAGFASDALEVALEGVDEAEPAAQLSAVSIARALTGREVPLANEEDFAGLRHLIAALAFSEDLERVLARLSPNLLAWLEAVNTEHGDAALEPARLFGILREMLGFELEYDDEETLGAAAGQRPFLLAASSSAWGGSDVNHLPQRRARVWLPSMTSGRLPAGGGARQPLGGASNWMPSMTTGGAPDWSPSMTAGASKDWLPGTSFGERPLLLRWRLL